MNRNLFLLTYCLFFQVSLTFSQDSLLQATLQQHQTSIQQSNGQWQGTGKDFLLQEAQQSQFFLIGEDHGFAELPKLTTWLVNDLSQKPYGYGYFATETGPITAGLLQEMTAKKKDGSLLAQSNRDYPWAIPFYFYQEEGEILKALMKHQKNNQPRLWGLDQEFIGAPRLLFQELAKMAKTPAAKAICQRYLQEAITGFKETIKTKKPSSIFMYNRGPEVFDSLSVHFPNQPEALTMIQELKESQEIYKKFFSRQGFSSNVQRAELMKKHFYQYYQTAKAKEKTLPKVLFKFGASHMYRGANGLNAFDIGNFASELTSIEDTKSFHLYVIAAQGTQNAYNPFADEADKKKKYEAGAYLDHIDCTPLLSLTDEKDWAVFDLRPLRELLFYKKIKDLDKGLEKLIWSYDAVLVIPQVTASTYYE